MAKKHQLILDWCPALGGYRVEITMSSIKKIDFTVKDEVSSLLKALRDDFPLSKSVS